MKRVEELFSDLLSAHAAGNSKAALNYFDEVLHCDVSGSEELSLISIMYSELNLFFEAQRVAERAASISRTSYMPSLALGVALQGQGLLSAAAEAYKASLAVQANDPAVYNNLASTLNELERYDDAIQIGLKGIDVMPQMATLYNNLGVSFAGKGRRRPAEKNFRKAIECDGEFAQAYYNLGTLLSDHARYADATDYLEKAVAYDSENALFAYNLANNYRELGEFDRAISGYQQVVSTDPSRFEAIINLSTSLASVGRLDEAERIVRTALADVPDCAELHWNLALILLAQGNYQEGWQAYEWRWQWSGFTTPLRHFEQPMWDGRFYPGKTILVHCEQGFGDNIQFSRYIRLLIEHDMRVVVEARNELRRLFETIPGVAEVIKWGAPPPAFDVHCPMLSLPMSFATTLETIPKDVPYLAVPPACAAPEKMLTADGLKVGIVCSGSKTRHLDRFRSVDFEVFAPLFELSGIDWFSLQVDADAAELPAGVTDLGSGFADFGDTAAAIEALDLVITVDTAASHLAGALGKPAWVMLSEPAGYLWMKDGTDSPWYPTLRLFRKRVHEDWSQVVARIRTQLLALI